MPLYFNLLISFAVGVLWVARTKRTHPRLLAGKMSWPLLAHLVFQSMVLIPIQGFHFRFHHDWSLGYLVDPDLHPIIDEHLGLWSFIAIITLMGVAIGGHFVGRVPLEKPKSKAPRYALGAAAGLALILGAVFHREFWFIGSFDEFINANARPLLLTPTGFVGLIELGLAAGFLYAGPRLLDRVPQEFSGLS